MFRELKNRSYLINSRFFLLIIVLITLSTGCHKWVPPTTSGDYNTQDRIQTQTQENITVSMAVPTREETTKIFNTDLYAEEMQPVWIKVENSSKERLALLHSSIDNEYYSINEAAYKTKKGYSKEAQLQREIYFRGLSLPLNLLPNSVGSGFIITRMDEGSKYVTFDILTEHDLKRFNFFHQVPGLKVDYYEVDFDNLYKPEEIKELTLEELRKELEKFPCCTFSKKGKLNGDPVNLVVIGEGKDALAAFVRAGWRETETQKGRTMKTMSSYLNNRRYDYAPMSPLWLFGRTQDAGFQKPRETPHERNHFRLWLTPWTYKGKPVWIGAISRDIGLRYTIKSPYFFITHKIDSDVDETREYFLEDLFMIGALSQVGWVKGVGEVSIEEPKLNPMGDTWYSDGLRLVLFISGKPVDIHKVKLLDWEYPPERERGKIKPLVVKKKK